MRIFEFFGKTENVSVRVLYLEFSKAVEHPFEPPGNDGMAGESCEQLPNLTSTESQIHIQFILSLLCTGL